LENILELNLTDKIALITGSYRGTGNAIASTLKKEGATVIVHGFEEEATRLSAEKIKAPHFVIGDISTDEGADQVAKQVYGIVGRVDLLINNYGGAGAGQWLTASSQQWIEIYQKNVISAVRLINLFLPKMKEVKNGRIVQISTTGTISPNARMPHYYASKGALTTLTVSLAKELANTGITVNTISPGLIKTDELEEFYRLKAKRKNWGESWEEIESAIVANDFPNPVGRIARREDIANLVAFLCSGAAGFINGQNICVDGGSLGVV